MKTALVLPLNWYQQYDILPQQYSTKRIPFTVARMCLKRPTENH
jgi:hypothetical protein